MQTKKRKKINLVKIIPKKGKGKKSQNKKGLKVLRKSKKQCILVYRKLSENGNKKAHSI